MGERALDQRGHPQRLGGDPDRLAARAAYQVVGVGVERVEVDHEDRGRQRRALARDGVVEAGPQAVAVDGRGSPQVMPRLRRIASISAMSSSVGDGRAAARGPRRWRAAASAAALGPAPPRAGAARSSRRRRTARRRRPASRKPEPDHRAEHQVGRPVGDRAADLGEHLQGLGEVRRERQQGEARRAQRRRSAPGAGTRTRSRSRRAR